MHTYSLATAAFVNLFHNYTILCDFSLYLWLWVLPGCKCTKLTISKPVELWQLTTHHFFLCTIQPTSPTRLPCVHLTSVSSDLKAR